MHGSTLLDNIALLTDQEVAKFIQFVKSEYLNQGNYYKDTNALLKLIVSCYPDLEDKRLEKENVYALLFPNQPIGNRLDKVMSELNLLVKEFLLFEYNNRDENQFHRSIQWLEILRSKVDEDKYERFLEKVRKGILENKVYSTDFFIQKYLLNKEQHEWMSTINIVKNDLNLSETINSLYEFFGLRILEHLNHALLQNRLTKFDLPKIVEDKGEKVCNEFSNIPNLFIQINIKINTILRASVPSQNQIVEFMEFLEKNKEKIPESNMKDFYAYLRNFCTVLLNAGRDDFGEILHEIQKKNLIDGYFYYNGKLPANSYLSIFKIAIQIKNYEWANKFMESHKDVIIGQKETCEFYKMAQSILFFEQNRFYESLDVLPFDFKNVTYSIHSKINEIKCYYELESPLFSYKIDAFKMYISRSSLKFLSVDVKEHSFRFVNFLTQITQNTKGNNERVGKIERKLKADPTLEKNWLLKTNRNNLLGSPK